VVQRGVWIDDVSISTGLQGEIEVTHQAAGCEKGKQSRRKNRDGHNRSLSLANDSPVTGRRKRRPWRRRSLRAGRERIRRAHVYGFVGCSLAPLLIG
jgi:hypothetical protein